jgi:carbon monoxide dehydrogenase subunit G
MKLRNEFEVPLPPDQAWDVLLDVPRIAPCIPGATLTDVADAKIYNGKVSVKIGPVALIFSGTAQFDQIDPIAYVARVKAQGSDTRGRGAANAVVSFGLAPSSAGSIVSVETDLTLSGSVAQYGRGIGIIQAVAAELTNSFSKNLQTEINKSKTQEKDSSSPADAPASHQGVGSNAGQAPISGLSLMLRSLWRAFLAMGSRNKNR